MEAVRNAVKEVADDPATQQAANDMHAIKQDLGALKKDLKTVGDNLLVMGRQRARELREDLTNRTQAGVGWLRTCVEDHPLETMLATFAGGALLGASLLLATRKNRR